MSSDLREPGEAFRLGVNYWPARTAMAWWRDHDAGEVARDFAAIVGAGLDSVRVFLTWEDFQPAPTRIDSAMLTRLVATLDAASAAGLSVMPTLFTGHMSGVNWIPRWALGGEAGDARFRVVAEREVVSARLRDWYRDPAMLTAQAYLAGELAGAVGAHPALWAWDLGNEGSNCVVPGDRRLAREWLQRVTHAIRTAHGGATITVGLHMEDLEQDRGLGPLEAAAACDFLTMHGYPGYAPWTDGPTDERLLPFLARVTSWLGGGAPVLFAEFGVPTFRRGDPAAEHARVASSTVLVEEQEAAGYVDRSLRALLECGTTGAMLWCHSDYEEAIWRLPPLDLAVHERSFGLWRADGAPKPAVAVVQAFAEQRRLAGHADHPPDSAWIDLLAEDFYRAPGLELPRLYGRYCEIVGGGGRTPGSTPSGS